jgi:hypothetical protein
MALAAASAEAPSLAFGSGLGGYALPIALLIFLIGGGGTTALWWRGRKRRPS